MVDASHREAVKALYPKSKGWAKRVKNMPDAQVFAIYKNRVESKPKRKVNNGVDSSRDLF